VVAELDVGHHLSLAAKLAKLAQPWVPLCGAVTKKEFSSWRLAIITPQRR
jgi:hypothetical protein